jgi:ergothioneine biosynthesis protein EgtB
MDRVSTLDVAAEYAAIRRTTEALCRPLALEDYVVQAMPDVSPAKWHLAHVTWFFETFVLARYQPRHRPFHPDYRVLFNSYYQGVGPQHARAQRGHLSRPTVAEIYAYRRAVDSAMAELLEAGAFWADTEAMAVVALGLNHEQQHQELLLTDIKYNLGVNPLRPAYHTRAPGGAQGPCPPAWVDVEGGLVRIGDAGAPFAFDNERPAHQVYLEPFRLAVRPVTNGEYAEFVEAGGYRQWRWWLSEGWRTVRERDWEAPLYWERPEGGWRAQTLSGPRSLDAAAPVCHVSYYEADAFARWRGCRLPTEQEWEHAVASEPVRGNFLESGWYEPAALRERGARISQAFGDVWEWTQSPYGPYPGYRPLGGALGEYNGKFMVNQLVLRGGSCATPSSHMRRTYRNFFPPEARWQFSGIRLAADA